MYTKELNLRNPVEGNWGKGEALCGDIYGGLPILTIPALIGFLFGSWNVFLFVFSFVGLFSAYSTYRLLRLIVLVFRS